MIGFELLFHGNAPGSADELDMKWEKKWGSKDDTRVFPEQ